MFSRFGKLFKDTPQSETEINLLLLGETGVGKSTFINSISNYFEHPKFKIAQKAKMKVLIPVRINLASGQKIYGEPDQNEMHENGAACTQQVKIYLFPLKLEDGRVINLKLVDTPGVGDPRGMDQDNINLDNVLAYLATLKKLHGICFVLKSNQTRFTKFIEYCLKQILTRLDKSASENIIFITTYSKTAQHTAGETMDHCLEPLVKNIKSKPPHVTIPLNKKNVFSVDNEAFKALLEIQEGKKFRRHELDGLAESWDVSNRECRRLLTYIIGDSKTPPLTPHEVESTVSVNEVRFLIEQLATPIAEVSDVIQDNLRLLDRHQKNLNLEDQSLSQLKQQLFIPCVDLQVTELNQPVTVCTDPKCADIVKVNDVTKWHYRQKCHNPCYLKGIPKEMIGDPGLVSCAAMSGSQKCKECGCHWQVHMHIYKTTEKIDVKKEDDNVKDAIRNKEDARVQIEAHMKTLNQRRKELEKESEVISESIAKFSYFLQEHALTPFNDAYSDYIQHLIKNEKSLGKYADADVIEKLQKLLAQHEHLQKIFQQNTQKFEPVNVNFDLSPQGIKRSISELYSLKHMGKKIQELIQKTKTCRLKETQNNFSCVVSQQINLRKSQNEQEEMNFEEHGNRLIPFKEENDAVCVGSDNNSDSEYVVNVSYEFCEQNFDSDTSNKTDRSQKSSKSSSSYKKVSPPKKIQEEFEKEMEKKKSKVSKMNMSQVEALKVVSESSEEEDVEVIQSGSDENSENDDIFYNKQKKCKTNYRNKKMVHLYPKQEEENDSNESKSEYYSSEDRKSEGSKVNMSKFESLEVVSESSEEEDVEVIQSGSDENSENDDIFYGKQKKYKTDSQNKKMWHLYSKKEEENDYNESKSEYYSSEDRKSKGSKVNMSKFESLEVVSESSEEDNVEVIQSGSDENSENDDIFYGKQKKYKTDYRNKKMFHLYSKQEEENDSESKSENYSSEDSDLFSYSKEEEREKSESEEEEEKESKYSKCDNNKYPIQEE